MFEIDMLVAIIIEMVLNADTNKKEKLQKIVDVINASESWEEKERITKSFNDWMKYITPKAEKFHEEVEHHEEIENVRELKVYDVTNMTQEEFDAFLAPYMK